MSEKSTTRYEWLANVVLRRGYKLGAEIGVGKGTATFYLLKHCPELHLICVDPWKPQPKTCMEHPHRGTVAHYSAKRWRHEEYKRFFDLRAKKCRRRITVIRRFSTDPEAIKAVQDLDFVFIDGDHSYEGCKKDILNWGSKIIRGGLVAGHDIHWPGVLRAVQEANANYQTTVNNVWYWFK